MQDCIAVRKLNTEDWQDFKSMSCEFYSSDEIKLEYNALNLRGTFELCLTENPYAECFIFEYESKMAGFALITFSWSNEFGSLTGCIDELFVSPEYRRKGIASEFFIFMESNYKQRVKRYCLEVGKANKNAFDVYKKRGFCVIDSFIMVKDV